MTLAPASTSTSLIAAASSSSSAVGRSAKTKNAAIRLVSTVADRATACSRAPNELDAFRQITVEKEYRQPEGEQRRRVTNPPGEPEPADDHLAAARSLCVRRSSRS